MKYNGWTNWETSEVNFECNGEYFGTHHLIKKTLNLLAKAEGGAK